MEQFLAANWQDVAVSASVIVGALLLGLAVHACVFVILRRLARATDNVWDNTLIDHLSRPARFTVPLLMLMLAVPWLRISDAVIDSVRHILSLLLIGGIGWLLIRTTSGLRDSFLRRYDVQVSDNLKARAVHTQINVLTKIVVVVIVIIAVSSMLMTFDKIRQVGLSLLASAGIAGIIVGFAAQRSIATLFAGIQIAITQPIRIDDVVIVEGEWGRIEEITLTYVVVRIWDLRRLVVPITYFIERPFQNWTRVTADLLGTVFLYTDYRVPIDKVREKLHAILKESDLWDGKVWGVQVTNTTDRTMELRALMSSADASAGWDLRCLVREQLLVWLQQSYPESLPRTRAELFSQTEPV